LDGILLTKANRSRIPEEKYVLLLLNPKLNHCQEAYFKSTYEDVMYALYVRMKVAQGRSAARQGQTVSHAEVKRRFGNDKVVLVKAIG